MERITYELKTRSSLILSPRTNVAFYKDLDEFSLDQVNVDNYLSKEALNVIYPFYQYGEYESYAPNSAAYYLPGSSLKGALCQRNSAIGNFMVDDVLIPNKYIVLRNLYKAQYIKKKSLEEKQEPNIAVFFENVGLEMIPAGKTLNGEFYLSGKEEVKTLLEAANESTKAKIDQMLSYLRELINRDYSDPTVRCEFNKLSNSLSKLEKNDLFLLGGYKGLLHTLEFENFPSENAGAVFFDPETMLPHGLVEIKLFVNAK